MPGRSALVITWQRCFGSLGLFARGCVGLRSG